MSRPRPRLGLPPRLPAPRASRCPPLPRRRQRVQQPRCGGSACLPPSHAPRSRPPSRQAVQQRERASRSHARPAVCAMRAALPALLAHRRRCKSSCKRLESAKYRPPRSNLDTARRWRACPFAGVLALERGGVVARRAGATQGYTTHQPASGGVPRNRTDLASRAITKHAQHTAKH